MLVITVKVKKVHEQSEERKDKGMKRVYVLGGKRWVLQCFLSGLKLFNVNR